YNLKAVVQETGVKPDTLRAWERRYGLPEPDRTPGGHRLYSQRDIDTLRWLLARQQEGLSISRAVELWRTLEAEGQDPLVVMALEPSRPEPVIVGQEIDQVRRQWMDACLAFDEQKAEAILGQAFALFPTEVVCVEILQRGIHDLGEGWYKGQVTVQQEHFASALAMRRLEALIAIMPPATRSGRVLVAAAPEEVHIFSQTMLHLLLRRRGWDVRSLGGNVPAERMEESLTHVQPDLVILTAQQLFTAASLTSLAARVQEMGVAVAYGGRIFTIHPELRARIPGHYLGDALLDAVNQVEHLLPNPPLATPSTTPDDAHRAALAHFRERMPAIYAALTTSMQDTPVPSTHMTVAATHMLRDVAAALELGDLGLLAPEIEWIEGLLVHHHI
ncbi:MAG: MerR family transcriptional regulator, partial [Caldilineae bacterium]